MGRLAPNVGASGNSASPIKGRGDGLHTAWISRPAHAEKTARAGVPSELDSRRGGI